ncbi:hypothetical protein U14_05727 [Candidatus Moduliflexus flocculans]|uniref:Uncharacterized protein n=1 Tax=Candidatus Moduliflexus flocculans TaxID=1499966 RepID=A0A081BSR1_9BACT|nr:hypothetical protein U14_05727 [Candidatus Moduliflexus flocculans]
MLTAENACSPPFLLLHLNSKRFVLANLFIVKEPQSHFLSNYLTSSCKPIALLLLTQNIEITVSYVVSYS